MTAHAAITVDGIPTTGSTTTPSKRSTTSTTYNPDGTTNTTTTTYQGGVIRRYYKDGISYWVYDDGSTVDVTYYGSLKTTTKEALTVDLANDGKYNHVGELDKYCRLFLDQHYISEIGQFIPKEGANTRMVLLTKDLFKHYVHENAVSLTVTSIDKCTRCSGTRKHPGVLNDKIVDVPCDDCNRNGSRVFTQQVTVINTARNLPPRPTAQQLRDSELVLKKSAAGASDKVAMDFAKMLDDKKAQQGDELLAKAAREREAREKAEREARERGARELTPLERFKMNKGKAEAGDAQAQYELGLAYAQEFERVVALDYFEAFTWFQKAANKNHRMALYQLGRCHELGHGTDKNLENAIKLRRTSALLGCKISQRWMAQLYIGAAGGSKTYEDYIKQDETNLIEAYAWALLAADSTLPERLNKTAGADEIKMGHVLTSRDYDFERGANGAAEQDRDSVARNPKFTLKMRTEAKLRNEALRIESEEYKGSNKPL
jgi:hypothetical protein